MNNKKPNNITKPRVVRKIVYLILKWLLIIAIIFVVLFLITSPLRGRAAKKYIDSGDEYLAQQKYLSAELEYNKALLLSPGNLEASEHKILADKTSKNILEFKSYQNFSIFDSINKEIDTATGFPESQSAAIKLSKKLIEEKKFQLAIIPAKTALEMDKEYRDAWLYLGIANLKISEQVELRPEIKSGYVNAAKEAFNKTLELDFDNQTAKSYLKVIASN